MASIFTKIIAGEIPCAKVASSETEIAFLDIAPWSKGHTLVVPKTEVVRLEELDAEEVQNLMSFLQQAARAVSKAFGGCDYNILLNNGPESDQEVPHVHFHIIPRGGDPDFSFARRLKYADGEMAEVAAKIQKCFGS